MPRRIRVVVAKTGLDGHDRGAITVALGLREAGMEVIYTGLRQKLDAIIQACVQEDADVLGLSILTGGHESYLPKLVEMLRSNGLGDVLVVAGGIIPLEDRVMLKEKGVGAVFGPGTRISDIARFIKENVRQRAS